MVTNIVRCVYGMVWYKIHDALKRRHTTAVSSNILKKGKRFTVWEVTHHMLRALEQGETLAADHMTRPGSAMRPARDLTRLHYHICEQKNTRKSPSGTMRLFRAGLISHTLPIKPHLNERMRQDETL